jgi:hypothetical protein
MHFNRYSYGTRQRRRARILFDGLEMRAFHHIPTPYRMPRMSASRGGMGVPLVPYFPHGWQPASGSRYSETGRSEHRYGRSPEYINNVIVAPFFSRGTGARWLAASTVVSLGFVVDGEKTTVLQPALRL